MIDHAERLRVAVDAFEKGKVRLRQARDRAVLGAHDAGMPYQEIATVCQMSYENARKIVREQRIVRDRRKRRGQ